MGKALILCSLLMAMFIITTVTVCVITFIDLANGENSLENLDKK